MVPFLKSCRFTLIRRVNFILLVLCAFCYGNVQAGCPAQKSKSVNEFFRSTSFVAEATFQGFERKEQNRNGLQDEGEPALENMLLPEISLLKMLDTAYLLPAGNLNIHYEFGIKNTGTTNLSSLSVADSLSLQIGIGFQGLSANPSLSLIASTATVTPALNQDFNGIDNNELLLGSAADLLEPGQEFRFMLAIEIDPAVVAWPVSNQAVVAAVVLGADGLPIILPGGETYIVNDLSDVGTDYEPEPPASGNTPTMLDCQQVDFMNEIQVPSILGANIFCANSVINLEVSENYPGANVVYSWYNGNDQLIGNDAALMLAADASEVVAPFYVVAEVNGCSSAPGIPFDFSIQNAPEILAQSNSPVCQGEPLFLLAGDVENATYTWYKIDPEVSEDPVQIANEQNPVLFDMTAGEHYFFVEVTDTLGCVTESYNTVFVDVVPIPVISDLPAEGLYCEGDAVVFTANNAANNPAVISYTWTGPGGFVLSGTAPGNAPFELEFSNINTSHEGTYTLSLETAEGCIAVPQSVDVVVDEIPDTPLLQTNSAVVCQGETLTLSTDNYSGSSVSYEWYYHNGLDNTLIAITDTSVYSFATVSENDSGNYSVLVMVGACESLLSEVVSIVVLDTENGLVANNTTTGVDPACENTGIELSVLEIPGATYTWHGPDNFESSVHNPVLPNVTIANAGIYYVEIETLECGTITSSETEVFIEAVSVPLITNDSPVCEGGHVEIQVSNLSDYPPDAFFEFAWYHSASNALVGLSFEPSIVFEDLEVFDAGFYYVVMTVDGCVAPASEATEIVVNQVAQEVANAGVDQELCSGEAVFLNAVAPVAGTGFWTSPTGAEIANPDIAQTTVTNLQQGENLFVWTLSNGACLDFSKDTTIIFLTSMSIDEAFAGEDMALCGNESIMLGADEPQVATGVWMQEAEQEALGVLIENPAVYNTMITGLLPGGVYSFTWRLSVPGCENYSEDEIKIEVFELPEELAKVVEEKIYTCSEAAVWVEAILPEVGAGQWSSPTGLQIETPSEAGTFVSNFTDGENMLQWSLSNGTCENYTSDTILIILEDQPVATPDRFEILYGTTLEGQDLVANDILGTASEWEVRIFDQAESGRISENITDGILDYKPNGGFIGADEFIYELCNSNCLEQCDTAIVKIKVGGANDRNDCWVPNVIIPNKSGQNDALVIACLDAFPENQIQIFNRWGDMVFEASPYLNNWEGTHNDKDLPAGTYFYQVQLSIDEPEILQGFFTLVR